MNGKYNRQVKDPFIFQPDQVFIDERHEKYGNCTVREFHIPLDAQWRDRKILRRHLINVLNQYFPHSHLSVRQTFNMGLKFAYYLEARAQGIKELKLHFKPGESGKDTAILEFETLMANHYMAVPRYGYFQSPGMVQILYQFRNYSNKGAGILKPFNYSQFGYKWNYIKYDSQYYFIQEFKKFSQYQIRTQYSEVWSGRVVEQNVAEQQRKSSLRFIYDLYPEQESELFPHSFIENPENNMQLKFGFKRRYNKVDTNHSSRALMEKALGNDELFQAKLVLKLNKAFDFEELNNTLCLKASTELISNSMDSKYIKSKFFTRYMTQFKQALFYASLTGGYLHPVEGFSNQKVNDSLYLKNFKGIRNIGYYYDQNKPEKGLSGENLGFDKYLNLNIKVAQSRMPLLSNINIEPFVNVNLALAPNRNIQSEEQQTGLKNILMNYGRASIGLGLSLQLDSLAIECYFNPLVYRQKNEIKSEFQINIGID